MRVASLAQSLVVGVALAWAAPASAQDGADAARRALIADAAAASQAGDHARAIELAARAAALRATPSLRYFLAREHLAVGHPVEALALAGECASGARADREVHNREALVARCEAVAAEAERGVARLTVQVPTPAPEGLRVTVGGSVLAPPLYAVAVPVVPGPTEVTASAPGRDPFRVTITLAAGARETLAVTLAALGAGLARPGLRRPRVRGGSAREGRSPPDERSSVAARAPCDRAPAAVRDG